MSELQDKLVEENLSSVYRPTPLSVSTTNSTTTTAAAASSTAGHPYGGTIGAEPSTPLSVEEAADFERALEIEMKALRAEFDKKIQTQLEEFNKRYVL